MSSTMELEAPPLFLETGSLSVPPKGPGAGGGRASTHAETTATKVDVDVHQSHRLDLSLGIALNGLGDVAWPRAAARGGGGGTGGGGPVPQQVARAGSGTALGAKRWFSETAAAVGGGYVDPWSLAARQETAALEQRTLAAYRRNINNVVAAAAPSPAVLPSSTLRAPTLRAPPSSPVVGWPPVRAFRKNLAIPLQPNPADRSPDEMIEQDSKKKTKGDHEPPGAEAEAKKATMFVKVNMEGCSVGRKVDLMAHDSYQSLSSGLQKMFHNFLTVGYPKNPKPVVEDIEPISANYILLYEDNEGDRLLVGDVPWELFVSSVKRLYIANGSKDAKGDEDIKTENQKLGTLFEQEVKAEG